MTFSIWLQSKAPGRLRRAAVLLLSGSCLSTCKPEIDCFKSNGPVITQRRAVDRRTRTVLVYDNVDLTIVPDTAIYAEVEAGEHVIDGLTLTAPDPQSLALHNTNRCNWTRSYDSPHAVRLHVPHLTDVRLLGYGSIRTARRWTQDTLFVHLLGDGDIHLNVASQYLYTDMYELGDFTLSGTADEFHPIVGGIGFLFADSLVARACFLETTRTSLGDAHLRATQVLLGTHASKGTLYYAGNPGSLGIRGAGRVVKQ